MKLKDLTTGKVFKYGSDKHHALVISGDGNTLTFEHLQNGDGSGEYGIYRFVDDDDETIPCETEQFSKYGADSYFNIGGFANARAKVIDEAMEEAAKAICVGCGYLDGVKCTYKGSNCSVSKPMLESVIKALEQMKNSND